MRVVLTLNEILERKNMTQRELSRLANIRPPSIHEMCHNLTVRLPLDNLARICAVLDCDISDIMKLEKEPSE